MPCPFRTDTITGECGALCSRTICPGRRAKRKTRASSDTNTGSAFGTLSWNSTSFNNATAFMGLPPLDVQHELRLLQRLIQLVHQLVNVKIALGSGLRQGAVGLLAASHFQPVD